MRRYASLFCVTGLALALAGCSEEEAVVEQTDPPAAEEPATEGNETADAMEQFREGVESLSQGTQILADEARERAEQALEDAGPALERAEEIAGEIGSSFNEIVQQAMDDFNQGAALLEQRIAEATGGQQPTPEPAPGDPDAALAPADQLNADTRAAARAGPAGVGPAYVGVWAADAASCALIDQEPPEIFAVITPSTIRRYESVCNFEPVEPVDGAATIQASCIAEASMEEREIVLETPSPDTLILSRPEVDSSVELTRCYLPE